MKKFLPLSISAMFLLLTFTSCNNDDENPTNEVRKILSKLIIENSNGETLRHMPFEFDEQNRLLNFDIIYNADGTIAGILGFTIRYEDNLIFIYQDGFFEYGHWMEINDRGQPIRYGHNEYLDGSGRITHNSNGNRTCFNAIYTNIPSIFRHINIPEWFFFWYFGGDLIFQSRGYMIKQAEYYRIKGYGYTTERFIYELDDDGYVTQIKRFFEGYKDRDGYLLYIFEWISVK